MAPFATIYSYPNNFRVQRVRISFPPFLRYD